MNTEPLKIFDIKSECTGCGACVLSCPKGCLSLEYDDEGFLYPKGNLSDCIKCRKCERSCHVLNGDTVKGIEKPLWWDKSKLFMFINSDTGLRLKSTSGGAMSAFANHILSEGGVLFASHYNGDLKRLEFASTDEYPLDNFRKSRYIESNTNGVYARVSEQLLNNRKVLFVGTPCQVSGLKKYLGKNGNHENLLTINFICHGVPSNEIFHNHISQKYYKGKLDNVDFRYKDEKHGWHQMYLRLYNKEKDVMIPYGSDEFYRSFVNNDLLRKSCYSCSYLFNDFSDITIADFWGIRNYNQAKDDNKGVSLVIAHNKKAESLIPLLIKCGVCCPLPYEAIEYILNERKVYHIDNRFKGDKKQYLQHIKKQYKWIIMKYKIRQWIKAIVRR